MSQQQVSGKKQQGNPLNNCNQNIRNRKIADNVSELQMQYSNFKDTLQNIASQIGNVEQEVEEHKYVKLSLTFHITFWSESQSLFSTTRDVLPWLRDLVHHLRHGPKKYCHPMICLAAKVPWF